jgi:hypothetical protein
MKGMKSALVDASRIGSSGKPLFNRTAQPQQTRHAFSSSSSSSFFFISFLLLLLVLLLLCLVISFLTLLILTISEFNDEDMYQILSMHESKERSQNKSKFATLTTPLMFSKSGGGGKFLVLGEDSSTPFSDIARSFSACALKYFQQIHKVVNYFGMMMLMEN